MNEASTAYGAVADWWSVQVTGIRTLRKPSARIFARCALVVSGLPQEVSLGKASRVLPRFQLGCIAATASMVLAGTRGFFGAASAAGAVSPAPSSRPTVATSASSILAVRLGRRLAAWCDSVMSLVSLSDSGGSWEVLRLRDVRTGGNPWR